MLKHYEAHAPFETQIVPDELARPGRFGQRWRRRHHGQVLYVDWGMRLWGCDWTLHFLILILILISSEVEGCRDYD